MNALLSKRNKTGSERDNRLSPAPEKSVCIKHTLFAGKNYSLLSLMKAPGFPPQERKSTSTARVQAT